MPKACQNLQGLLKLVSNLHRPLTFDEIKAINDIRDL